MRWISLLCGLLFGLGLTLSGMVLPEKVVGFLDIAGNWDPSLALVMGGALLVFMPGYFLLIKPRHLAVSGEPFHFPKKQRLDRRLIVGSGIFGVGWGLVGICPGPALVAITTGALPLLLFIAAMLVGIKLVCWWQGRGSQVGLSR